MPEIRPVHAADAPLLTGLLTQLGYSSDLDAVTARLAWLLNSATSHIYRMEI